MSSLLFVRKVYQMTVISVVLVALITIIIALALVQGTTPVECVPINITVNVEPTEIDLRWSVNPCAVAYHIVHYVDDEIHSDYMVPHPVFFVILDRFNCTRNTVVISTIPFPSHQDFDDVATNFSIGYDGETAVKDLRLNLDNRQFEWQGPNVSESCDIEYHIEFSNGHTTPLTTTTTNEYYVFPIYACAYNKINVTTWIGFTEEHRGSVTYSHYESVPDETEVRFLEFDTARGGFTWEGPEDSSLCEIEYEIMFTSDTYETEYPQTISEEFWPAPVFPCGFNKIEVVTLVGYDATQSYPVTGYYRGALIHSPLEHISTTPTLDGAHVQWNATQDGYNFCELYNFTFEIVNLDYEEDLIYPIELEGIFDLLEANFTDLQVNTSYSYQACYFIGRDSDFQQNCTKSVEFITEIIQPPIVFDNYVDSSLTISWVQSTNRNFATGHSIKIIPLEPIHFVPKYCNWDLEVIEESFAYNVTEFYLGNVVPSFMYHVDVTTYFEGLGLSKTNYSVHVTTGEHVPGSLDISANFDYVPATSYNVTLQAQWDIPCDINGNVNNFSYTLEGVLKSASSVICDDVGFASGIIEVDEPVEPNGTVTLDIPGLLPFFDYYLTITTSVGNFTNDTTIQLKDVPQAYAPPS